MQNGKTKTLHTFVCRVWWARVDSNHRSIKQQIYSLSPLATREHAHIYFCHPAFVLPADLLILPQPRRFVKKFFQLSFFTLCCVPAGAGLLAYFITGGRFCQRVISAFFAPGPKYLKILFGLVFFSLFPYNKCSGNRWLGEGFWVPCRARRPCFDAVRRPVRPHPRRGPFKTVKEVIGKS